jgi:outer membrane receptor protein involved in Fe transport
VFASYGEGFTLPNVGIPLRNISTPGRSVAGILDLQAIVVENKEIGFNWRGARGGFGGSYYDSEADYGQESIPFGYSLDFPVESIKIKPVYGLGNNNQVKEIIREIRMLRFGDQIMYIGLFDGLGNLVAADVCGIHGVKV